MKRILCLWLPHWSLQCLGVAKPSLRDRAVILRGSGPRGGEIVADCSSAAWRQGIRAGMPLAEALALGKKSAAESLSLEERSSEADRDALGKLAHWCERFSPLVGWAPEEDSTKPTGSRPAAEQHDTLFLDITGLAVLFGGEVGLVRQLLSALTAQGYYARVAVTETLGASYALARHAPTDLSRTHPPSVSQVSHAPSVSHAETNSARRLPAEGLDPTEESEVHGGWQPLTPGVETLFQESGQGTRAAAWVVAPGRVGEALSSLPVRALRLPAETARWLDELGIVDIGQLANLPRASLGDRFGDVLLRRLDQALGTAPETLLAHRPPPEFRALRMLEFPLEKREAIEFITRELLVQIEADLRPRDVGALQLSCRFDCSQGDPVQLQLQLFQPTASTAHLLELIGLQLERLVLPGPVERVMVEVGQTARLQEEQTELFPVSGRVLPREVTRLIDRLSSRLGSAGVVQPRIQPEAQPERAFRYIPWNERPPERRRRTPVASPSPSQALARPLYVLAPAQPLEVLAVVPDGPPQRFREGGRDRHIVRHWGPERVETGWWRGRSVRRDYYRVETRSGQRFWLYRRLEDGRWFLHGTFE